MASVDETDRAILSALRDNSRQAFVELAKVVGVSERTIRTRVRRLEEDGIIRGYTIRETGIGLTALIRMKVGPGVEIGSLAGEFANWPSGPPFNISAYIPEESGDWPLFSLRIAPVSSSIEKGQTGAESL